MLTEKHRRYIVNRQPLPNWDDDVPLHILASWKRSLDYGISWKHPKNYLLTQDELKKLLTKNNILIKTAHSYIVNLYRHLNNAGIILSLSDSNGVIIDFIGDNTTLSDITNQTNLYLGAMRDEKHAGTTAIGLCLITQSPMQICGAEHFCRTFHQHIGTAAPIKDSNKNTIGILGSVVPLNQKNQNYILAMICSAADSISSELTLEDTLNNVRKVKNQLSTTIEALPNGVIMTNLNGTILQHNHIALKLLQTNRNIVGLNVDELIIPRNSEKKLTASEKNIHNVEYLINSNPKQRKSLSVSTSFIYNQNNEINGKIIILDETNKIHHLVGEISGYHASYTFSSIIGSSNAISRAKELAHTASLSPSNVLILGESGTGKELFAHAIHNASRRANFPFIAVNCASLPRDLIESELFGYIPGAFTGASRNGQPGKFELANGGTIFLDEIGDMPLALQGSLLRVLQTKAITRLGDSHEKKIDVKIITATNVNLEQQVQNHMFRSDLYYRLNVLSIDIPPLRKRKEDIPELINHFITEKSHQLGKSISGITPRVSQLLCSYSWPGNIRELENALERAVNLCTGETIDIEHLPSQIINPSAIAALKFATTMPTANPTTSTANNVAPESGYAFSSDASNQNTFSDAISYPIQSNKDIFLLQLTRILSEENGNVSKAASRLHISRRTLYRKIEKYNIDLDRFRF
jgi:sigma-54 dependent transcriptional regulator, acetoin dehydrogenase operon transcriptional activator AcoR